MSGAADPLLAALAPREAATDERRDGDAAVTLAFVVPQAGEDLDALRETLAAQALEAGRRVLPVFVDRIPRLASGAPDREALAALPVLDPRRVRRQRDDLRMALGAPRLDLRLERTSGSGAPSGPRAHAAGARLAMPPEWPTTLPGVLEAAARDQPTHGVIAYDAAGALTTISYPLLLERARGVAVGLDAAGLRPGELALLVVPELADYFPALWGCLLAGVLPMTLSPPESFARRSAALDKLSAAWEGCGRPWILSAGTAVAGLRTLAAPPPRVFDVRNTPASGPAPRGEHGDGVALLQLSSGTTGRAKPIQLTHRGLLASARDYRDAAGLAPDDRSVNWFPLDHSAGLLLTHLFDVAVGATSVHAPSSWVLDEPLRWLDLLERHDAQHSWAPNFAYRLVAAALEADPGRRRDLGGVKSLLNGGEQCTTQVIERFLAATAGFGLRPGHILLAWGMAETTTAITYKRYDAPGVVRSPSAPTAGALLSVGPPCPNSELRIVDDAGQTLGEREIGRLLVRSERNTPGYLVDGAVQPAAGADGWLDTGDLAFLEDGEVAIAGRAKDVIIVNGVNLLAHEVEDAVTALPGVREGFVAAVGVPDPTRGTEMLGIAYVATGPEHEEHLRQAIPPAVAGAVGVAPAIVQALPAADFPRTSSGKIQRARLRERLGGGAAPVASTARAGGAPRALEQLVAHVPAAEPPVALPALTDAWGRPVPTRVAPALAETPGRDAVAPREQDVAATVAEVVAALVDGPADPERPFYELGLGSLELTRARAQLERRLGLKIAETTMFGFPTIAALGAHLAAERDAAPAPGPRRTGDADAGAIAIVGMACRFPGARTPDEYWRLLRDGTCALRRFSAQELLAAGVPPELVEHPEFQPVTGFLEDVDLFAPEAFGMTQREATLTSPQQRLLLEVAQEALIVGGHETFESEGGIGVFAGVGMHLSFLNTYLLTQLHPTIDRSEPIEALQLVVGNEPDFAATRIAYRLGLTGPAVCVQTACSTSLSALHAACRALQAGDCDVAIAGAGAVSVPHPNGYVHRSGSILSPSGACRPFDACADGTVGGCGVAAVLLKPLAAARADGDAVHAVVRGSATRNDGAAKVGFAAPSARGQRATIARALAAAGVRADTIAYVQAHATGTPKGDPIEVCALAEAYGPTAGRRGSCLLGSVKANVGHLDTCAGFAGLFAAVGALQHGEAPPQIAYDEPNPELLLDTGPFRIPREPEPLVRGGAPLRASVSALGVGGTNVHVVLEEAA